MDGKEVQEWRKGPWTCEEDKLLCEYVKVHGEGRWTSVANGSGDNFILFFFISPFHKIMICFNLVNYAQVTYSQSG